MTNEIISKLEQLEQKIQKLIVENFEYREKIANFEVLLKRKNEQLQACDEDKMLLKQQVEQLKLGKAFAGNVDNNEEAKRKIDSLIKEINLCIAALKD